jgi:hypothetical protein
VDNNISEEHTAFTFRAEARGSMCLQNRGAHLITWCHNPDENMKAKLIHTPVEIRS